MDLTCPKCHGTMRSYERSGVTVDQCSDCRGLFLDRGELENLIDAENSWHARPPQPTPGHPPQGYPQGGQRGYPPYQRKRKSFLDELFD